MKSTITVLIFAWLIFTAPSANASFFNFSLWDLFWAAVLPEEDHRTSLERAVDLPEDTLQKRDKKIAQLENLLVTEHPGMAEISALIDMASLSSSLPVLRLLLSTGASVNAFPSNKNIYNPALFRAINNPDPGVFLLLLDSGADPNSLRSQNLHGSSQPSANDSVLIWASYLGKVDMVKLLIDRGAKVNYYHDDIAVWGGTPIISVILGHGYMIEHQNSETAALFTTEYTKIIKMLLEHGADVNQTGGYSQSHALPLEMAINHHGSIFVPLLLEYGAQVNVLSNGNTPLIAASKNGDLESVRLLLSKGADVRALDSQGRNALVAGVTSYIRSDQKLALVEQLVQAGAPLSVKNGGLSNTFGRALGGATSSIQAHFGMTKDRSREYEVQVLLRLIELGVDLDAVSSTGETTIDLALAKRYTSADPLEKSFPQVAEAIALHLTDEEKSAMNKSSKIRPLTPAIKPLLTGTPKPPGISLSKPYEIQMKSTAQSIAISPDGMWAAVGDVEGMLHLWNISLKQWVWKRKMERFQDSLPFSPDSKFLLIQGKENSLEMVSVISGGAVAQFSGHASGLISAVFSPDGKKIFSLAYDNTIMQWEIDSKKLVMIYSTDNHGTKYLAVAPDGKTLLTNDADNTVSLWSVVSGKRQRIYGLPKTEKFSIYSPDGKYILADIWSNKTHGMCCGIVLFDATSGQEIFNAQDQHFMVESAAFSPDGTLIASAGSDVIRLYDAMSGILLSEQPLRGASKIVFSADGSNLISVNKRGISFFTLH